MQLPKTKKSTLTCPTMLGLLTLVTVATLLTVEPASAMPFNVAGTDAVVSELMLNKAPLATSSEASGDFGSDAALKDYLDRLQLYYALVSRPRFGKRSI